mgnify:CR=1 FL=1
MNKSELIKKIANKQTYLKGQDVKEALDILLTFFVQSLYERKRIEIRGFGSFSVRKRKERNSRNPKTGETIIIDSRFYPYFRSSKSIKQQLNKS